MYSTIWIAMLREVLICERELDNTKDRYAVAMLKQLKDVDLDAAENILTMPHN